MNSQNNNTNTDLLQQAEDLFKQASDNINYSLWNPVQYMSISFDNYQNAIKLFYKSGNLFKSLGQYSKAYDAYSKASDCCVLYPQDFKYEYLELQNLIAQMLCMNGDYTTSVEKYRELIELYKKNGNKKNAAKCYLIISTIYSERGCILEQYKALDDASVLYNEHGMINKYVDCTIEMALVSSRYLEKYDNSIELFEEAMYISEDSHLMKNNVVQLFVKSIVASMCTGDYSFVEIKLDEYENDYSSLYNTIQLDFIKQLVEFYRKYDYQNFNYICQKYSNYFLFDDWLNTMLKRVSRDLEHGFDHIYDIDDQQNMDTDSSESDSGSSDSTESSESSEDTSSTMDTSD